MSIRADAAHRTRRSSGWPRLGRLGLTLVATLAGCDKPSAFGEANSLIVIAPDSLWNELQDTTYTALEPTIFTTRDEKRFVVTQTAPNHPEYRDLRAFRNVVVFGTPENAELAQAADAAGLAFDLTDLPTVFQSRNVWARGQTVTAVALRPGQEVEGWVSQLDATLGLVDSTYREFALQRMFATPPDTALANDLADRFGFSLLVPTVYDRVARGTPDGDSLVILRNDNPDPSELIRSVLIEPRPRPDSLTADAALEWRSGIDSVHYNVPQRMRTDRSTVTRFMIDGRPALEVTGIWEDEQSSFPAAGPFILWAVDCPDATYFIDAWLYAPNRSKYEYMLQLQQILRSFRCAARA